MAHIERVDDTTVWQRTKNTVTTAGVFGLKYVVIPVILWLAAAAGLLIAPSPMLSPALWLFPLVALAVLPLRYIRTARAAETRPTREGFGLYRRTVPVHTWAAPAVMFVVFLLTILLGKFDDAHAYVFGNAKYHESGLYWIFPLAPLLIALITSILGLMCYYEVLRISYQEDGPSWKIYVCSVLTPLLLFLPLGLSVIHNARL